MKWGLDPWYELWYRAGSRGVDTWYDPRGIGGDRQTSGAADTGGATDIEPEGA